MSTTLKIKADAINVRLSADDAKYAAHRLVRAGETVTVQDDELASLFVERGDAEQVNKVEPSKDDSEDDGDDDTSDIAETAENIAAAEAEAKEAEAAKAAVADKGKAAPAKPAGQK